MGFGRYMGEQNLSYSLVITDAETRFMIPNEVHGCTFKIKFGI